jgi:aldehyde:ferredoxin oxidoreductase
MMPHGYTSRILRINLTQHSIKAEELDQGFLRRWLGGPGVAARLLYEETSAGADAYGPENKLLVMTGPLTGSQSISMPRYAISSKSPLNGFYGSSSSSASWWRVGPRRRCTWRSRARGLESGMRDTCGG